MEVCWVRWKYHSCCGEEVKGGSEEQPLRIGTTQRVAVEMSDIPPGIPPDIKDNAILNNF